LSARAAVSRIPSLAGTVAAVALLASPLIAQTTRPAELPPNELGRVMILEYHKIDHPEERWTRTPANFRRDLQRLWERGYRLVSLGDYLDGKIALPKGTTPLILTFDDSSPGQFRYIEKNGGWEIDPDCAVGILEQFEREHPEFGRAATFYVLPGASPPNRLFNQPDLVGKKLVYLKSRGFEIGNHTLWHANLAKYEEATVRKQLLEAQEWVQRHLPGYRFRTLALPMGSYPKELAWAISGSINGSTYRHDAILMVAGGAALSPHARGFDPYHLPRIQATEAELSYWIKHFDSRPDERYVSDGDPGIITVAGGKAAQARPPGGARVIERR
jgi:peptidoglycan/xylan/chitin deacetylase (PgdA/CDA1 family)